MFQNSVWESQASFDQKSMTFIQSHQYFTESAASLWNANKQNNLDQLQTKLMKKKQKKRSQIRTRSTKYT